MTVLKYKYQYIPSFDAKNMTLTLFFNNDFFTILT